MQREMEERKAGQRARAHSLHMDNREKLVINGVNDVESFDETEVRAATSAGCLVVTGKELRVSKLNLDECQLIVQGHIASLCYQDGPGSRGSMFSRLFK